MLLLLLSFSAGWAGAFASSQAPQFYQTLVRPGWAPPAGVFGPVWTALYTLIAVAAYVVVRTSGWRGARVPLLIYALQLVANALWTWLFFSLRSGAAAFLDIVVLFVLVAAMLGVFWRVRPVAGALLVPYLAWVGFASALTWSVWRLNPGVL